MTYLWKRPGKKPVEVGNADECGALLRNKVKGKTFSRYSREGVGTASGNPCPKPVTVDLETRRPQWILDEVRAWDAKRLGPGDHGGKGYHHRAAAHARQLGDATLDEVITTLDEIIAAIDAKAAG